MVSQHTPVLLQEVLVALDIREGGRYLDATFGRGGHSAAILERVGHAGSGDCIRSGPGGDPRPGANVSPTMRRLTLVSSAFSQLGSVVTQMGLAGAIDGVLLDLGVSSPQLDDAARGFSFMQDGPLDMRMDVSSGMTAAEFVAKAPEHEIARVIREFGEERFAKRVARAIVNARRAERRSFVRCSLAEIVAQAIPMREPGKHPATRTFQAIRIHVNREFEEIGPRWPAASLHWRRTGGLCAISFHSLEDNIVKRFVQEQSQRRSGVRRLARRACARRPKLRRIGKAIHPGEAEVAANPRARSSVMRVAERVAA